MAIDTKQAGFYGDFSALAALKKDAKTHSPEALRKAAQEFESLFTNMLLKSMRSASFGDALTGSSDMQFYQGMADQQLATQLSKGKGLGLADMLVQQLTRSGLVKQESGAVDSGPKAVGKNSEPAASILSPATVHRPPPTASIHTPPTASIHSTFIAKMMPHARQAAAALGVDPAILVAHAALETGWGKHMPHAADGTSSNNLFGIKAGAKWNRTTAAAHTLEYVNGAQQKQVSSFRTYDSPAECFADYCNLLTKPRYANLRGVGADGDKFAHTLQSAGYATDPAYASKLQSVLKRIRHTVGLDSVHLAQSQSTPGQVTRPGAV